jgi:hypothetical protein
MPTSRPLRRYAKTNDQGNIVKRFSALADIRPGDVCWRWLGKKNPKGYGYFGVGGQGAGTQLAHRVAYRLFRGRIPKGLWVLHRCDNPSCVNPSHLFLGTAKDNMQDAKAKGRLKPPPVRRKLTGDQVAEIRASGEYPTALGRRYGVSAEQVRRIKNGVSRVRP